MAQQQGTQLRGTVCHHYPGKVRVKVTSEGYFTPEYEDCRKLALASGVALKHIIAEANSAYLKQQK